jgi:light-regulated signal transduction histidine kinase (bacteriophytochrome)
MQFGKVASHESFSKENRIFHKILFKPIFNTLRFVSTGIVSHVEIDIGLDNGKVRIWVKDNGTGMDDFYHQQLFRIFESLCKGNLIRVELPKSPEIK